MKKDRIQWFAEKEDYFNDLGPEYIRAALEDIDDATFEKVKKMKLKNPNTTLALSILLGLCGADRYYLKDIIKGILKFFTMGGFIILFIIDIFTSKKRTQGFNTLLFFKTINAPKEMIESVKMYNKKVMAASYNKAKNIYTNVKNDPGFKQFTEGFKQSYYSGFPKDY